MGIIDKITIDDQRHEVIVRCDGQSYRITTFDYNRLAIEQGEEVSEDTINELILSESRLACIQKAFVHLSYGDLSKKRLSEKLRRAFSSEICTEVVDLLEERGYINDLRLAERYADNYYSIRSYGPLRIKQELHSKGFSRDIIETVLEPYISMDHREKVQELLEQKFKNIRCGDYTIKKKAAAWLNRQGYSWSDISDVLSTFFQEND